MAEIKIVEYQQGKYTISTDPARLDLDAICAYLGQSYWAANRPRETIERSLQHSLCFGAYEVERQIGLTRAITDYATYAYLADVYILEEYQGQGLGKWLISTVMQHPDLQGLRLWSLRTRDAHGLYRQFGFHDLAKPEIWQEYRPDGSV